jgi:hypothetical protein
MEFISYLESTLTDKALFKTEIITGGYEGPGITQ